MLMVNKKMTAETPATTKLNLDSTNTKLDALLDRINGLTEDGPATGKDSYVISNGERPDEGAFYPQAPQNFEELGVTESSVEEIITKFLLARGEATIREIAEHTAITIPMAEQIVGGLKKEQLLGYIGQAALNDYVCKLTELGANEANDSMTFAPTLAPHRYHLNNTSPVSKHKPSITRIRRRTI